MFTGTYTKAVLMVIPTALTIIALNRTPAFTQASMGAFTLLSKEQKFYYVYGYLDGFAWAAQMPPDRAALLQKCFADFGTAKTVTIFEAWIVRNPEKTRQQEWTTRAGLFVALAEACGWKQR
jgi:hypothetical protein